MECPRCHYRTQKKCNYLTHLSRKTQCSCTYSNVTCEDLLMLANEKKLHLVRAYIVIENSPLNNTLINIQIHASKPT